MKDNTRLKWLRIIISSIVLFAIFLLLFYLFNGLSLEKFLLFLFIGIIITALLNKTKDIKDTISTGILIGIIPGIFFICYYIIDANLRQISDPTEFIDYALIIFFSIQLFIPLIIVCILGSLLSYHVRKWNLKKKTEM